MEEAVRVNPYNLEGVARALHIALSMSRDERLERMRALQLRERRNDLYAWLHSFLDAAATPGEMAPVRVEDLERWLGPFLRGFPLALFLDYDGTLAEIARHPSEARLEEEMRALIEACAAARRHGRGRGERTLARGRAQDGRRPRHHLRQQSRARDRRSPRRASTLE
jgi:hypothetical protein